MKPPIVQSMDIEKLIERLRKDLASTYRFKIKIEQSRSNIVHFLRVADQNLKHLRKHSTIAVMDEYKKVIASQTDALKQLEALEAQIRKIEDATKSIEKRLEEHVAILKNLKNIQNSNILVFDTQKRRRGS